MQTTIVGDALGIVVISKDESDIELIDVNSKSSGIISYNILNNVNQEIDVITVIKKGVETVKELLERNKISILKIAAFIPQNINYNIYTNIYAKFLGIPKERMFLENIPKGGHLGDIDIIRNLKDFKEKNILKKGDYIVLYGLGGPIGKDKDYHAILAKYNK